MRKAFNFIIVILFCLAIVACSTQDTTDRSKDGDFVYKNLIEDFEVAEKLTPIKKIDLTKKNIREHLDKGWSNTEGSHRWAVGLESELYFFSLGDSDIDMTFDCWPFVYDKSTNQSIKIYLNSEYVSEIEMKLYRSSYKIHLPFENLRKGRNHLRFKYKYAERPSVHFNSGDTRMLSVAFKRIQLSEQSFEGKNFTISKIQNKIVQQPRTLLNYYYRMPSDCHLEVEIDKINENVSGNIEIKSNKGNYLQVKLNRVGSEKISLDQFSDQFVRLSFRVDITSENRSSAASFGEEIVTWSRIAMVGHFEEPRESAVVTKGNALKEFRDQIRDLDIIYIIFDAFNANHSSLYGYERKTTPFLENLAEKSIVFDNFYANHPYTLASTATLLTSLYSYEHGLIDKSNRLGRVLPTLPEVLADNQVCSFLITGHSFLSEKWGLTRGFTKVFFDYYKGKTEKVLKALENIYNSEYSKEKKFIYLHLIPPHEPYDAAEEYRIFTNPKYTPIDVSPTTLVKIQTGEIHVTENQLNYVKAMYDANVLYADHIAKDIFEFIHKNEIHKKAIIIITSDHGEAFMEHDYMTHNDTIYDEMIHIPLIISFPDNVNAIGKRIEHIASIVDIAPTILDIFAIPSDVVLQGESILPMIFGFKGKDYIYAETLLTGQRGIRDLSYKFISTPTGYELYDIITDPSEHQNLFGHEPIISGYFIQKIKPYQIQNERGSKTDKVDLKALDDETVGRLRELGYIK